MEQASVPLLAIALMGDETGKVVCLELPKGDRDGELDDSQTWGAALERVRVARTGDSALALDGVEGAKAGLFRRGPLSETVAAVQAGLGAGV